MSRLILKRHGMNRRLETSPLAIGQSVAVLRDAPAINWLKLFWMLGLRDEWMQMEVYDAEMEGTLH